MDGMKGSELLFDHHALAPLLPSPVNERNYVKFGY